MCPILWYGQQILYLEKPWLGRIQVLLEKNVSLLVNLKMQVTKNSYLDRGIPTNTYSIYRIRIISYLSHLWQRNHKKIVNWQSKRWTKNCKVDMMAKRKLNLSDIYIAFYKITTIVCALWLAERRVCMSHHHHHQIFEK